MEYRRREIAAGLVIVVSIVLMLAMVALSSNVQELFRKKKEFQVRFLIAEGVEINTPVKQAGILVGKISAIGVQNFNDENRIVLTLKVRTETIVKRDSKVTIKSPLVGEKYVDIGLGSPDSAPLMTGDMLDGIEGLSLDQLTDTIVKVVSDIQSIVNDIRKVTGDPQFQQDLKGTVSNLENASSELQAILQHNRGNINSSISDLKKVTTQLNTTAQQLSKLTRDVNRVVAENRANIHSTIQNLRDTPDQLLAEVDAVQQSISGPLDANREDLKKIMENLEKMTQNLVEMTEMLKKHPSRLIRNP
jgi:phospholipid/cholesterol/gamma-HCH transport system substrate-binding protein